MNDPLGLLPATGVFAAEELATRLREVGDVGTAKMLGAQNEWLRSGDPSALVEVVRSAGPGLDPKTGTPRYARIGLGGVFDANTGHLGREMWLYDDDRASLIDGGLFRPNRHATPWDANDDGVVAMLAEAVTQGRYPVGVRLLLFEGTGRLHAALRRRRLARNVTHLELRLQSKAEEPAVVTRFPNLRGLAVGAARLRAVLREPVPELRSLTVLGPVDAASLGLAVRNAPQLAHLGLWYAGERAWPLDALLEHAERLMTLQLFDVNYARGFPFAELYDRRAQWRHLRLLGLPGHLVPAAERARFADEPAVVFVGFDRREVIALDMATHGWPHSAR